MTRTYREPATHRGSWPAFLLIEVREDSRVTNQAFPRYGRQPSLRFRRHVVHDLQSGKLIREEDSVEAPGGDFGALAFAENSKEASVVHAAKF